MTDNSSEVDKQAEKEKKKKNKGLTDKDLELLHGINLTETETTIYFFLPSAIVQQDTPVYSETVERNKKYDSLLKLKLGSDNYNERASQSFNYQPK